MIPFKDFDKERLHLYSSEQLRSFINEVEMKKSVIAEECASEIGTIVGENFDIYSSSGERKVKKIAKKYSTQLAGADVYLEILENELNSREEQDENLRYSGKGQKPQTQVSEEEFLQKEQDKTWVYRSKIE